MPRGYRDCMFRIRSEWLKDTKFKSLVGLLNMIGKAKTKALKHESESTLSLALDTVTVSVSDTDRDIGNDSAVRISELRFLLR